MIEASLPIGFVKQNERTDHPSREQGRVEPLVKVATVEGDSVVDSMAIRERPGYGPGRYSADGATSNRDDGGTGGIRQQDALSGMGRVRIASSAERP